MNEVEQDETGGESRGQPGGRERSTIVFPYDDLDAAVAVASAIYNNVGTGECEAHQIAGWMNAPVTSGSHRIKVSAARHFGFVANEKGKFSLTQLGKRLFDASQKDAARVEAFLTVPLYKKIYDEYKGHDLPNADALEQHMSALGVSSKQTDKARQAFERSADQAGFFRAGKGRLIAPGAKPGDNGASKEKSSDTIKPLVGGPDHPLITGLWQTLPQADTEWDLPARVKWLQTAAGIFGLIYRGEGEITVKVADGK